MNKFSTYALVVAACLGTTAVVAHSNGVPKLATTANLEAQLASDGAFRDGLYLGRLAAEHGQPQQVAVGRWSTERDRSMFAAGYQRGYTSH